MLSFQHQGKDSCPSFGQMAVYVMIVCYLMSRILWGLSFAILMLKAKIASQDTPCSLPRCLLRPLEQYTWAKVGENIFGLCIISFPGQICDHCHSPSSLFEDSFQPTFAPDEEPAHQQNPHGLSHQVHRVLQGNFLEEEGYCILIERNSSDREGGEYLATEQTLCSEHAKP